ncbi:MAG: hypothetical protein M3R17_18555 [Bacteroidota bacterium]|nr:hypothetical protein [Bacteroidota bacterium]
MKDNINVTQKEFQSELERIFSLYKFFDSYSGSVAESRFRVNQKITPYTAYDETFVSNNGKRVITISLMNYETTRSLFWEIINKESQPDKLLDLYDYLEFRGIKNARFYMTLENHAGIHLIEKLNSFFQWFSTICDEDLRMILIGETWVDITFDWKNYK